MLIKRTKTCFFPAVKPNALDGSFYNKGSYHTLPIKFLPIKFILPGNDFIDRTIKKPQIKSVNDVFVLNNVQVQYNLSGMN
jgi:hypothetical protein